MKLPFLNPRLREHTVTINGAAVSFCTIKGAHAPSDTFEVALPVSTWTQRFAALGRGALCGNLSDPTQQNSFSFSYTCPLVQEGGFVTAATDMAHSGNVVLYADKAQVLHKAVIAACNFDPASIECPVGATDTSNCLTAAEVSTAGKIYGGPLDAISGVRMLAGSPQPGSEINWIGVEVPGSNSTDPAVPVSHGLFSYMIVTGAYKLIFTGSPTMPTIDTFGYTDANFYPSDLQAKHPLVDATNPDLSAFQKTGGKLILWHGWADRHISPLFTINCYESMKKTMGDSNVDQSARLYLVPGVGHCGGGEDFPNIDLVSQATDWVEQSKAPAAVTTYWTDSSNAVTASRPVYPYPAVAMYSGTGDWKSAANYTQGPALYAAPPFSWAGASFYAPHTPAVQGVPAP